MLLDQRFPPDIRVENESASLLHAGHEVHILCSEDARANFELPSSLAGLVVHTTPRRIDLPGWRRFVPNVSLVWFYDARWARRIREVSSEAGPFDAIHVHDLPLLRTAQRVAPRIGAAVVADLHENYPMVLPAYLEGRSLSSFERFLLAPSRWERYERASVPLSQAVIAVTDRMASRLMTLGVHPDRVSVVENFVQSDRFLGYPIDDALGSELHGRYVVVYVGGFVANRGLDTTLRALQKVVREVPRTLLLLVGSGAMLEGLEALTRDLGLRDHVRFEGWVDFSRIPSYLAASDVCVIPLIQSVQTDSALSHKLFQYMLMGKPVLASSCVEMSRVVQGADCGLLFPPGDSDAMARELIRLTDPELRARLGDNGRRAVHDRYAWSHAAERLLEAYGSLERAGSVPSTAA
jgi:glycosyltransferase involved in cell wall biosynthesis